MKPDAAIKQIEYWEDALKSVEVSGVKGVLHDLASLKTKLHADPIDGEAVKKLVEKLGGETARIAGRVDGPVADRLKTVGDKLEKAG